MDVIADRELELRTESGTVLVIVSLGRPHKVGPDEWACEYGVRFGDAEKIRGIHGGDSLQALQLSMASVDLELELGARCRGGKLFHLDEPFNSVLESSGMQPRKSAVAPSSDTT
jgi:hypothetical protein